MWLGWLWSDTSYYHPDEMRMLTRRVELSMPKKQDILKFLELHQKTLEVLHVGKVPRSFGIPWPYFKAVIRRLDLASASCFG